MSEAGTVEPNPYAPPATAGEPEAAAGDMTWHELYSFAGPAAMYWWRLSRNGRRAGLWLSWNWSAFIFSVLWLAYRKMWREFGIYMMVSVVWDLVELVLARLLGREYLLTIWATMLPFGVVMGLLGNALYVRRARLEVAGARAAFPDDFQRQAARLASVGGTSWWWVLAGLGASVVAGWLEGQIASTVVNLLF